MLLVHGLQSGLNLHSLNQKLARQQKHVSSSVVWYESFILCKNIIQMHIQEEICVLTIILIYYLFISPLLYVLVC